MLSTPLAALLQFSCCLCDCPAVFRLGGSCYCVCEIL